eukprot:11204141-Lingulodinium_polyedra.AAC.1
MERRAVLGVRRAVNMLTARVRKWSSAGPSAGVGEEPADDEQDDGDPDFRLPRTGRIAVWESARASECL